MPEFNEFADLDRARAFFHGHSAPYPGFDRLLREHITAVYATDQTSKRDNDA